MTEAPDVLRFLQERNSSSRLTDPGPDDSELDSMLRCALRSPDHAWLRPWRFVSIRGERRAAFGELLCESLLRENPQADEAARHKALNAPLRAPLMVVVMASITEHPKVPAWEQQISAGCAAFSLTLAAEALGYAAIWRTGAYAEDAQLAKALGGSEHDKIVGFIYLGTRDGKAKPVPDLDPQEYWQAW